MTLKYAAPELWEGRDATHESDLYAMGVLLYQCLAGGPPFTGTYFTLRLGHTGTPPDLDALPPETPMALRELIRQCLEKDPAARPTDAAACIRLLERAAAELTAPPVQEPTHFGPWIRRRPHATQAWAWRCEHETTGEAAIVEVHSFQDVNDTAALRAAVNASPRLTPFGAERLLGTNRILLHPDETWRDAPAGPFQFWVARDELPPSKPPAEVSVPRLRRATDALLGLIGAAAAEDVAISLASELVSMLPDGSVHVSRPGLIAGSGDPMAEAMAFLRGLPLDEDARRAVSGATDLRDLRLRLPAAPFVADLLGANTVQIGGGRAADLRDPTDEADGDERLPRTPATTGGRHERPRGRRAALLAFFSAGPQRYRVAAAAVLAVGLASSALGITYAGYMRDEGSQEVRRGGVAGVSANPAAPDLRRDRDSIDDAIGNARCSGCREQRTDEVGQTRARRSHRRRGARERSARRRERRVHGCCFDRCKHKRSDGRGERRSADDAGRCVVSTAASQPACTGGHTIFGTDAITIDVSGSDHRTHSSDRHAGAPDTDADASHPGHRDG